MMTVNEVSKRTGVSIRTLQYYDKIGLLRPAGRTEAGYRLYDDARFVSLHRLPSIRFEHKDHGDAGGHRTRRWLWPYRRQR